MTPTTPNQSGRGECASECVEFVWSTDPTTWIGIAICVLYLITWCLYVRPKPDPGEDDEENDDHQR